MIEDIFTGSGDTIPPTVVGIIIAWALEIPAILFMTRVLHMDQNGVWWAIVISTFIGTVIMWKWYRRGRWLERKV
jgi:Na+-driven multidrug efflux pump